MKFMDGTWIVFEGSDGSGKSTQARLLAEAIDAVLTFEPGNTATGNSIRELVLHGEESITARGEALLFAADRAEHLAMVVEPALRSGRHVVSDRSVWSSVVYQGIARGLGVDEVVRINEWATNGRMPDVVVYLRGGSEEHRRRVERRTGGADRIEREGEEFAASVAAGFDRLARERGWIVIEGGDVSAVHEKVLAAIEGLFDGRRGR